MTLEEAIKHAEEKAEEHSRCGEDHAQLARWLRELQELRGEIIRCGSCRFAIGQHSDGQYYCKILKRSMDYCSLAERDWRMDEDERSD